MNSKMEIAYRIPGMILTRTDVAEIYALKMPKDEAHGKAQNLTYKEMKYIAESFSEEFFDVHENLFKSILYDAIHYVKDKW
jgi:hypothetical protein